MRTFATFGLAFAVGLLVAATGTAQTRRPPRPAPVRPVPARPVKKTRPVDRPHKATQASSLSSRRGLNVAKRSLNSSDPQERARALTRLGALATPVALEALAKALEPGGAARTSYERWVGVRALAPHARVPVARLALARALSTPGDEATDAYSPLVGRSAALALARAADDESLAVLGQALRQEGPAARAALDAIVAHPPRRIAPLLTARGTPTLTLVEALGRLGDQRAFHTLRDWVRRGSPEIRAAAAVELTRLGDFETIELARVWVKQTGAPALRNAALEILLRGGEADAARQLALDLERPESTSSALSLASRAPRPEFGPALVKLLDAGSLDDEDLLALLGRTQSDAAVARLARALEAPHHRAGAALALATMPSPTAGAALEKALGSTSARAWALRGLAMRDALLGDGPGNLGSVSRALLTSEVAGERAAAAWTLASLSDGDALRLLSSKDDIAVIAVARQSTRPPLAARACTRLATETSARLRLALAACLADAKASQRVPSTVLHGLVDDGGEAAPLAARALAMRDDLALRKKLEELAASPSESLRAHVLLGLGASLSPSAQGIIAASLERDASAIVRHAAVIALSMRREKVRRRSLAQAAAWDPDVRVRSAARLALGGRALSAWPQGAGPIWAELTQAQAGAPPRRGVAVRPQGTLSVPLVSDPDGAIVALGFPDGPVELETGRSALAPGEGHAQSAQAKTNR